MAERRMFAKKIVTSDLFLDMPMSAKFLYFMLGMLADDDGFVDSPNSIMRQTGTTQDDLRVLISKNFVRLFESGVIVVTAWRVNNYLRNDRYTPTVHVKEFEQIDVDKNGMYTDGIPTVYQRYTSGIPSIGKDSIGKVSIESMHASKKNNLYSSRAHAYACDDYEDVMNDMALEEEVKPMLWSFIKHCQINGKKVSNDKLVNILLEMDKRRLSPSEKIELLQNAINGGYYDIKRG